MTKIAYATPDVNAAVKMVAIMREISPVQARDDLVAMVKKAVAENRQRIVGLGYSLFFTKNDSSDAGEFLIMDVTVQAVQSDYDYLDSDFILTTLEDFH